MYYILLNLVIVVVAMFPLGTGVESQPLQHITSTHETVRGPHHLDSGQWTVDSAQCTVHGGQCTVHSGQCTMHSVQCTVDISLCR